MYDFDFDNVQPSQAFDYEVAQAEAIAAAEAKALEIESLNARLPSIPTSNTILPTPKRGRIIKDLPNEDYHNKPEYKAYLGSSTLKNLYRDTPLHLKYKRDNPPDSSNPHMRKGNAVHDWIERLIKEGLQKGDIVSHLNRFICEPADKDGKTIISFKSKSTVEAGINFYSAVLKQFAPHSLDQALVDIIAEGFDPKKFDGLKAYLRALKIHASAYKPIVTAPEAELLKGVANELNRFHEETGWLDILYNAVPESSWFTDEELKRKARPDIYLNGYHINTKCTHEVGNRQIYNQKWQVQVAHYKTIIDLLSGGDSYNIFFLIQSKPPYQIRLVQTKPSTMDRYLNEYWDLLEDYKNTALKNEYPGYEFRAPNSLGIDFH